MKNKIVGIFLGGLLCLPVCMLLTLTSCQKTVPEKTYVVDTPIVAIFPSGIIDYFTISDTLVGYDYYSGATMKWLVTGTNSLTVVTIKIGNDGVKVSLYGVLEIGRLKGNTVFTLVVNNGASKSILVQVADPVTTLLWNGGKRLKMTERKVFKDVAGFPDKKWVPDTLTSKETNLRTSFHLDGNSSTEQFSPVYSNQAGKFHTTDISKMKFDWDGIEYTIVLVNKSTLNCRYDNNGIPTEVSYMYE